MNHSFQQIQKEADQLLAKGVPPKLCESVDSLLRMVQAIITTKGEGWAEQAVDQQGNPLLTTDEQRRFTELLHPYVPSILSFFTGKMEGGQAQAVKKDLVGMDNFYEQMIDKVSSINSKVMGYASDFGILRLEHEGDEKYDLKFPEPAVMEFPFLKPFYLPVRTLVYLIQLVLDIVRISMSMSGNEQARKTLSFGVALIDLLRGDWKKALLSLIGYYGTAPLLIGQFGKIYLSLFRMFSPTLQRQFTYGALDASKSFLVGVLLSIFQLTAPIELREPLVPVFQKIALVKKEMDGMLSEVDLLPRPDYFTPSFEDLNNLQALIDDPTFICSSEFQVLLNTVNKSSIINIVLQILRIPVTEKMDQYRCPDGHKPIVMKMIEEGSRTQALPHPIQRMTPDLGGLASGNLSGTGDLSQLAKGADLSQLQGLAEGANLSQLGDLAKGANLSQLGNLAKGADLSKLQGLAQGANLSQLGNLAKGADLSKLQGLAQGANLSQLGNLAKGADLSKLQGLAQGANLSQLGNLAKGADLSKLQNLAKGANLSQLAKGADLSKLQNLAQGANLSQLGNLAKGADLSKLQNLAKGANLSQLAKGADLSKLQGLAQGANLSQLQNIAKGANLSQLAKGADLSKLQNLAKGADLSQLAKGADLSKLQGLANGVNLSQLAKDADLSKLQGLANGVNLSQLAKGTPLPNVISGKTNVQPSVPLPKTIQKGGRTVRRNRR